MRVTTLVGPAVVALALATPLIADPADRYGHDGHRYGVDPYGRDYRNGAFDVGFDKGYDEGLRHGKKDVGRRADFNFWHDGHYREGDHGYHSSYGSRARYVQGFRSGYEAGYREAYDSAYYGRSGHRRGGVYGDYGPDGYYGKDRYYPR